MVLILLAEQSWPTKRSYSLDPGRCAVVCCIKMGAAGLYRLPVIFQVGTGIALLKIQPWPFARSPLVISWNIFLKYRLLQAGKNPLELQLWTQHCGHHNLSLSNSIKLWRLHICPPHKSWRQNFHWFVCIMKGAVIKNVVCDIPYTCQWPYSYALSGSYSDCISTPHCSQFNDAPTRYLKQNQLLLDNTTSLLFIVSSHELQKSKKKLWERVRS